MRSALGGGGELVVAGRWGVVVWSGGEMVASSLGGCCVRGRMLSWVGVLVAVTRDWVGSGEPDGGLRCREPAVKCLCFLYCEL